MMLTEVCHELNNWFEYDKHFGTIVIEGGAITPPLDLKDGQYYRIVGSVFNDGVYKHGEEELTDEAFDGAVWLMSVPKEVIELSKAIDDFNAKHEPSPYVSESFGGYSYTKATGQNGAATWRDVFGPQLRRWRKL